MLDLISDELDSEINAALRKHRAAAVTALDTKRGEVDEEAERAVVDSLIAMVDEDEIDTANN